MEEDIPRDALWNLVDCCTRVSAASRNQIMSIDLDLYVTHVMLGQISVYPAPRKVEVWGLQYLKSMVWHLRLIPKGSKKRPAESTTYQPISLWVKEQVTSVDIQRSQDDSLGKGYGCKSWIQVFHLRWRGEWIVVRPYTIFISTYIMTRIAPYRVHFWQGKKAARQ